GIGPDGCQGRTEQEQAGCSRVDSVNTSRTPGVAPWNAAAKKYIWIRKKRVRAKPRTSSATSCPSPLSSQSSRCRSSGSPARRQARRAIAPVSSPIRPPRASRETRHARQVQSPAESRRRRALRQARRNAEIQAQRRIEADGGFDDRAATRGLRAHQTQGPARAQGLSKWRE